MYGRTIVSLKEQVKDKTCPTYVLAEGHIWGNVNTGGLTVPLGEAAPVGKVGGGEGQAGREEDEKGEKKEEGGGGGGEGRRGTVTHGWAFNA